MKPNPQIQPPLFIKPKLPNLQSSTHKKSRNHSLKKIPYYHQNNTNNQSHSLNSLGLFPKIQQKFKKHQIINKNNGQTSLQKNAAKWYLPNGHLKKRQKLLTQANNVSQQFILCDQSFISLTNKLMATQGDIKDTMIDFKKKIQMNKLFIKKEIERKNKQNQSTIIKKDLNEWGRKNRAVSSRVVQLNDDGYSGESSFNNNSRGNNNNINVIVNCNINKDWQSQMNKNNNTKKRTIQTPKSKLQSSLIKHTNNKANNSSSKKKKRMSSNNHNNTNLLIESNQRRRQKTQILQPSSTSSGVIINSNINNRRQVGNIDQRQKNQQKSLRSMSKRKSEGLFGELQGMLDQKIRDNNYHDNHNKNDRLSEKDDINGRRQLQYHQEESKLRELLNKLYKHKSNTNNNSDSNNNNHNIQNNNQQHYLSINKNNNNIIITQPFHKHYHHHSASGQLLVLQQSTDNLAQSSMTSCEKIKNNQQITYNQWNRLQLESTSQITYRKSSFQQQLNKLSQYAQRNDASLQKYIGMRKELMKLGFQVNANHNNNKNIQNNNNNNQNNNKNNNNKNNQNNNKNNHNNKKYNNNKNQTINVNNIKKNPTKDNR